MTTISTPLRKLGKSRRIAVDLDLQNIDSHVGNYIINMDTINGCFKFNTSSLVFKTNVTIQETISGDMHTTPMSRHLTFNIDSSHDRSDAVEQLFEREGEFSMIISSMFGYNGTDLLHNTDYTTCHMHSASLIDGMWNIIIEIN